ncbi:MAG: sugar-binding domain-containing protein [Propionibacteriaceae bacterium]|nr:sugar-binding domain-containing protein [Propionibacteriaceae bacterium]
MAGYRARTARSPSEMIKIVPHSMMSTAGSARLSAPSAATRSGCSTAWDASQASSTLELAARSDIALTGVGAVSPRGHPGAILSPWVTPEIAADVHRRGAVAHLSGHYFNAAGEHVKDQMCDRPIAMAPERLADIDLAIGIGWGVHKVPALHAALQTGLLSALATDEETTRLILIYEP